MLKAHVSEAALATSHRLASTPTGLVCNSICFLERRVLVWVGRGGQVQRWQGMCSGVAAPQGCWAWASLCLQPPEPGPSCSTCSPEASHAQQLWSGVEIPTPASTLPRPPSPWGVGLSAKQLHWDTQNVVATLHQKGRGERLRRKAPPPAPQSPSSLQRPPATRLPLRTRRGQGVLDTHEGDTPSCRGRSHCPRGSG